MATRDIGTTNMGAAAEIEYLVNVALNKAPSKLY